MYSVFNSILACIFIFVNTILKILKSILEKYGLSNLFITHNREVAQYLRKRIQ